MAKTLNYLNRRRLLSTSFLFFLFIFYLFVDIDFLIAFDNETTAEDTFITAISINTTPSPSKSDSYQVKPSDSELQSRFKQFGFDKQRWSEWRLTPRHCPYIENICVHRQHFYVFDNDHAFKLHPNASIGDIFGYRTKYAQKSLDIFRETFDARVWNQSTNEHKTSHCTKDIVSNHMILSGIHLDMIGEYYLRIQTALFWIFNEEQLMDQNGRNYKIYLMLPEFQQILLSHRVLLEQYSKHEILSFVDLFEHHRCKCFDRLFFCGFYKQTLHGNFLKPKEEPFAAHSPFVNKMQIFHKMIRQNQAFIDEKLGREQIKDQVIKWKEDKLRKMFASNEHKIQASEWQFIGFYQRTKRRKWKNMKTSLRACNNKYNEMKIACVEINLEGFLHSNDLILIHRSMRMVVGIHGATLTDAVFMENDCGNYIVELMPHNGPDWTASLDQPTLSGALFWNSSFNYVGLQLQNKSVVGDGMWYDQDFIVDTDRLFQVIDFLIVDEGGYCQKFQSADAIQIPDGWSKDFAIYNAYCPQIPDVIHSYVKQRFLK